METLVASFNSPVIKIRKPPPWFIVTIQSFGIRVQSKEFLPQCQSYFLFHVNSSTRVWCIAKAAKSIAPFTATKHDQKRACSCFWICYSRAESVQMVWASAVEQVSCLCVFRHQCALLCEWQREREREFVCMCVCVCIEFIVSRAFQLLCRTGWLPSTSAPPRRRRARGDTSHRHRLSGTCVPGVVSWAILSVRLFTVALHLLCLGAVRVLFRVWVSRRPFFVRCVFCCDDLLLAILRCCITMIVGAHWSVLMSCSNSEACSLSLVLCR